jgi:hypothetical protein
VKTYLRNELAAGHDVASEVVGELRHACDGAHERQWNNQSTSRRFYSELRIKLMSSHVHIHIFKKKILLFLKFQVPLSFS